VEGELGSPNFLHLPLMVNDEHAWTVTDRDEQRQTDTGRDRLTHAEMTDTDREKP
jgi:hypothetical protein